MSENEIAKIAVDVAYHLHSDLGPGLLESVYQELHVDKLRGRGLTVETEVDLPIVYDGKRYKSTFRIDILIEKKIVIELKSVENLLPVHKKQLLTYLKLSNLRLGLLINFGSPYFKSGIERIINATLE
ncbi:MAG: GxxExxY protein [Bacteroidota bacterium]